LVGSDPTEELALRGFFTAQSVVPIDCSPKPFQNCQQFQTIARPFALVSEFVFGGDDRPNCRPNLALEFCISQVSFHFFLLINYSVSVVRVQQTHQQFECSITPQRSTSFRRQVDNR